MGWGGRFCCWAKYRSSTEVFVLLLLLVFNTPFSWFGRSSRWKMCRAGIMRWTDWSFFFGCQS
jgi:hypothetical protein